MNSQDRIYKVIEEMTNRYPQLDALRMSLLSSYAILEDCYMRGGKVLVAGNGGSAADSEHIVGELMKSFKLPRKIDKTFSECLQSIDSCRGVFLAETLERSLPAIALTGHYALATAYSNDVGAIGNFAQQLYGYAKAGDVFLAISTSGNSENIVNAAVVAKALGVNIIGLTGISGGKLSAFCDVLVNVPETETYKIQELHLPIYHGWCLMLEQKFFGKE